MVSFRISVFLAIAVTALSSYGLPVERSTASLSVARRNFDFGASEELQLRDESMNELFSRDSELLQLRDELIDKLFARDSDIDLQLRDEIVQELIARAKGGQPKRSEIVAWLNQAKSGGAVRFGKNSWEKMHSGGTSVSPNCRPWGFLREEEKKEGKGKKAVTKILRTYMVKLECPEANTVISPFTVASGENIAEPSAATVYAALIAKANQLA